MGGGDRGISIVVDDGSLRGGGAAKEADDVKKRPAASPGMQGLSPMVSNAENELTPEQQRAKYRKDLLLDDEVRCTAVCSALGRRELRGFLGDLDVSRLNSTTGFKQLMNHA